MPDDVRKVLVVDDSNLILSIIKDVLETLPSVAVTAMDNARDAVNLMTKEGDYALVLLDVEMPGMTGLEALDELRQRGFDTRKVVVCSGDDSPELCEELDRRNVEFLHKPVEPQALFLLLKKRWGVDPPQTGTPHGELLPATAETLQHFNGNLELYEKSLGRFLDEYRRWLDVRSLGQEFPELKEYRFFLHTLKGVSSYLGAAAIVQKVGLLQDSIRKGTARADLALRESGLLLALQSFLKELIQSQTKAPSDDRVERGTVGALELLKRTVSLVESRDSEALDTIRQIDPRSLPEDIRPQFQEAVGLVLDYEFEQAVEILKAVTTFVEDSR